MKYKNTRDHNHKDPHTLGVLVTNLGTPDAPTPRALRVYLKQFLSDPRVVEFPRLLWWLVLNLVILRFRPAKSAEAYKTVWTKEGSPLLTITQQQAEKLQQKLGPDVSVAFGMRYGNPSLSSAIESLLNKGVRKLLILPLYPQYSATTTASTFDAISHDFTQRRWLPDIRFVSHYHDHDRYINACKLQIEQYWQTHGRADKLVLSYHGIPKRYLENGDPYFCECHKTSRLIADALGLTSDDYLTTFQSRFGREPWLQPYTDETLKSLPTQGVMSVQVFCPGFSADCLETIEEINVENREYFLSAGGERFDYIEALNASEAHIDALAEIVQQNLQGWQIENQERPLQSEKAVALGASQ